MNYIINLHIYKHLKESFDRSQHQLSIKLLCFVAIQGHCYATLIKIHIHSAGFDR